ncbi:MAG: terpene cyclase/mutase family protein [Eubacterium sp.]|nr:terpene cyclase/mutase family protein [Eubacterium sp.]
MKRLTRKLTVFLCVIFTVILSVSVTAEEPELDKKIEDTVAGISSLDSATGMRLADQENFPAGESINDWTACNLSYGGSKEYYAEYLNALRTYVERKYAEEGSIHEVKATEYHRIALTVMALGGDPESFGQKPDGSPINLIADGTYNFVGENLGLQGLNGWIWALITLNASGAEVPVDAKYQIQDIVEAILAGQERDGGFGLDNGGSDVNITAMALQALSPYALDHQKEILNALNWLSLQLNDDCTVGKENSSESIAQIIMALCSLEFDPEEPSMFVRGDHTLLTALDSFRLPDGTYTHSIDEEKGNSMSTCQALEALISLREYHCGAGYVFSQGYNIPNQNSDPLPDNMSESNEKKPIGNSALENEVVVRTKAPGNKLVPILIILIIVIIVLIVIGLHKRQRK